MDCCKDREHTLTSMPGQHKDKSSSKRERDCSTMVKVVQHWKSLSGEVTEPLLLEVFRNN